jgi:hypothetical protein
MTTLAPSAEPGVYLSDWGTKIQIVDLNFSYYLSSRSLVIRYCSFLFVASDIALSDSCVYAYLLPFYDQHSLNIFQAPRLLQ